MTEWGPSDARSAVSARAKDPRNALNVLGGDADAFKLVAQPLLGSAHVKPSDTAFFVRDMSTYLTFPKPQDLHINMMPIKLMDSRTWPESVKPYTSFICACTANNRSYISMEFDCTGYLTIQEGWVEPGETQRRPGLHIESPTVAVESEVTGDDQALRSIAWGGGMYRVERDAEDKPIRDENGNVIMRAPVGGIFMANNVADSCAVWPCVIEEPEMVADAHGGIERLRPYLPKCHFVKPGELVWFTDRTPHESLPVTERVYRQFFRLVVGDIGVWHSKHNTPNPLGVQPNAPVCHDDKFA